MPNTMEYWCINYTGRKGLLGPLRVKYEHQHKVLDSE